jgi:nitric oxide reductase large subunit
MRRLWIGLITVLRSRSPCWASSGPASTSWLHRLRWLRVIGDTVFAAGAIAFALAIVRMTLGRRRASVEADSESAMPAA